MSVVVKCDRCNVGDNKLKPGSEDLDGNSQPIPGTAKPYLLYDIRCNQREKSNVVFDKNICEVCLNDLKVTWVKENLTRPTL